MEFRVRGSIRTRLLAAFLLVAVAAAAGLSAYFLNQIEAFGLRRLEERLYSEARVSSAMLGAAMDSAGASSLSGATATRVSAALAQSTAASTSRIMVVDATGKVLADSAGKSGVGANVKRRSEVATALRGGNGASTSTLSNGRVALFVAAPVRAGGRIVGATYVTASTFSVVTLLADYRGQLAFVVIAFLVAALAITELLTRWLTRPLRELQAGAAALASDSSVRVRPAGPRETHDLAVAFNDLAEVIETSSVELHEEETRKSRFISDVSHELRSPLTGIRLAAETLLQGDIDPADEKRFLETIIRESDRLTGLANDLLELQRIEGATGELPLGRVDFTQAARLAVEANEPLAMERGVTVAVEGSSPAVLGSRDRLQQVVGNLVDNATRHTPAGRHVTVALSEEGGAAVLRVLDEGPGIPSRDLANLFQRFYRAQYSRDRATGGAGLGLAIVKAIVTAHRGTIEAANRPEGGAVFTVRLPKLDDSPS
jgi:two-component system, OmpR family, sensor kinase